MPTINNRISYYRTLAALAFSGDETAVKALFNDNVLSKIPNSSTPLDAQIKGFIEGIDFVRACVEEARQESKKRALDLNITIE